MRTLCFFLLLLALPATAGPNMDEARKLLSHYGWTTESDTVEMSYLVPDSLGGDPQSLYQSASRKIGLDLTPAIGQEIALARFTLHRRSDESKSKLYAHVAFYKNRIVGAWLATNAPIAPGIAPLDSEDFGQSF